jgi:hypothetical protein
MKKSAKYVVRAVPGKGWRIWKRNHGRGADWWGEHFREFPSELVNKLNGQKRPDEIVRLTSKYRSKGD